MTDTAVALKSYLWDSAAEAFETMVMIPIEEIEEKEYDIGMADSYTGSITFMGDIKGVILIQCQIDSAEQIMKSMLMMEEDEEVEPSEVKDAVGEVANLIIGGIKSRIADTLGNINISIPMVVEGQEVRPAIGAGAIRAETYAKSDNFAISISIVYKPVK